MMCNAIAQVKIFQDFQLVTLFNILRETITMHRDDSPPQVSLNGVLRYIYYWHNNNPGHILDGISLTLLT